MHIPRIYQASNLKVGDLFCLDNKASHHIANVLRLKEEAPIIIFNGFGGEFCATLKKYNKREAFVQIETHIPKETESPLHIHLGQSICRNDKMDYIIQKAVELGVGEITPLLTKRTEIKLATPDRIDKRQQRWNDIVISACEQCGRNKIPPISNIKSLHSWFQPEKAELRFILTPHEGKTLSSYSEPVSSVCILVGPESGFDSQELELALKIGFQPLQIGPRILRTETAALAVISALQSKWGDFG
jgi:16S rRNA (uracil1498-N3)-methyltransferase